MVNKRVWNAVLGCNLKNDRMISFRFQGKPFNITVIQVYAPTSNAEEAEVEQFYENLQDLLELTPKKDVLFIIGDWNAEVGSVSFCCIAKWISHTYLFPFYREKPQRVSEKPRATLQSCRWWVAGPALPSVFADLGFLNHSRSHLGASVSSSVKGRVELTT